MSKNTIKLLSLDDHILRYIFEFVDVFSIFSTCKYICNLIKETAEKQKKPLYFDGFYYGSSIKLIEWLRSIKPDSEDFRRGFKVSSKSVYRAIEGAVQYGHLDVIEYMISNNYYIDPSIIKYAIINGHSKNNLKIILYLFEDFDCNNSTRDTRVNIEFFFVLDMYLKTLFYAVQYGYLDIIEYLSDISDGYFENSLQYNGILEEILITSAQYGHLHIIEWLYYRGLLFGNYYYDSIEFNHVLEKILITSAQYGHLDIIVWLCDEQNIYKCIYKDILTIADSNNHYHISQWVRHNP